MSKKLTTEEFIQKSRKVHGDLFNYDKVEYKNAHTKVTITCPDHGDFEKLAANHMYYKIGCPKCSGKFKPTAEEFVQKAREKHGDRYNYNKVEYKDSQTKVIITCPEHGDFEQQPANHIRGKGCPACHSWTGKTRLYLAEIESNGERLIKVGITNHTVEKRYNNYHHPNQTLIREIAFTDFEHRQDAKRLEKDLLEKYAEYRKTPETKFAGYTECMSCESLDTLIKEFQNIS